MSRINYDGWDDDNPTQYLWSAWQRQALTSRASLPRWAALETALLALPAPQLCADWTFDAWPEHPYGQVCVVGAYLAGREAARQKRTVADVLAAWNHDGRSFGEDDWDTIHDAEAAGLPRTFAWFLVELNDETAASLTPEARYQYVLAEVQRRAIYAARLHDPAARSCPGGCAGGVFYAYPGGASWCIACRGVGRLAALTE